jgi:hypothetical protein
MNDQQKGERVGRQLRERISLRYGGRWVLLRRQTDLARVRWAGPAYGEREPRLPKLHGIARDGAADRVRLARYALRHRRSGDDVDVGDEPRLLGEHRDGEG